MYQLTITDQDFEPYRQWVVPNWRRVRAEARAHQKYGCGWVLFVKKVKRRGERWTR